MAGGGVALGEDAGAFHHDVDLEGAPGQLRDLALGQNLDRPGAALQRVALELHPAWKAAVHRVVLQEMRVGGGRRQVVDRHDLDVAPALLDDCAQHVAADPAEAVDRYTDAHGISSSARGLGGSYSRLRTSSTIRSGVMPKCL
jgi:hypothetical protein